jgi:hypothetical protein
MILSRAAFNVSKAHTVTNTGGLETRPTAQRTTFLLDFVKACRDTACCVRAQ